MRTQCLNALRRDYPEVIINEENIGFDYATGAWNNGKPLAAVLPSFSFSLSEGEARMTMTDTGKELHSIFTHPDIVDKLLGKPNALLFIHFGMDDAVAFVSVPKESYRLTMYNKYAVPVEDLKFVTTFNDPTTEMRNARLSKQSLTKKDGLPPP